MQLFLSPPLILEGVLCVGVGERKGCSSDILLNYTLASKSEMVQDVPFFYWVVYRVSN